MISNIDTELGTRAFNRLLFGGYLLTDWLIGTVDSLERKNLIPSSVAEKCRLIFTNNRSDI